MVNLDCVPISAYCQYTGESIDAINKRLQRQFWIEGVHVSNQEKLIANLAP